MTKEQRDLINHPKPKSECGRRAQGTNPRALGTNPRAIRKQKQEAARILVNRILDSQL